jgi:hypothetical protein
MSRMQFVQECDLLETATHEAGLRPYYTQRVFEQTSLIFDRGWWRRHCVRELSKMSWEPAGRNYEVWRRLAWPAGARRHHQYAKHTCVTS